MELNLYLDSTEKYEGHGTIISLEEFLTLCEEGAFIDYDGFAKEILIEDNIVLDVYKDLGKILKPSYILENGKKFEQLQEQHKGLKVVWYNK